MPGAVDLGSALMHLHARDAGFVRVSNSAHGQLRRLESRFDRFASSVENSNRATSQFRRGLVRFAAGAAAGRALLLLVNQAKEYSDTWVLTNNRLRLVTNSQEELQSTQRQVLQLAQDTRSEYGATVELYSRISRSSREFGVSQSEVLGIARTVNQAIRIGGATAQEARAGVIQFGQALASGQLRGEELRSVMEQLIRLSQALAAGLGVGIGDLRRLAESGQLTTNRIIEALQSQAPLIQEEFEQLTPTISETFTVLNNRVLVFVGNLSEVTGAASGFNAVLRGMANAIESITPAVETTITDTDLLVERLEEVRNRILAVQLDLANRRVTQAASPFERAIESLREQEAFLLRIQELAGNATDLANRLVTINNQIEQIRSQISEIPARRLGGRGLADRSNRDAVRSLRERITLLEREQAILQNIQNRQAQDALQSRGEGRSEENTRTVERILQTFRRRAEAIGRTRGEVALLRAEQAQATAQELESLRVNVQRVEAYEEEQRAIKDQTAAIRSAAREQISFVRSIERETEVTENLLEVGEAYQNYLSSVVQFQEDRQSVVDETIRGLEEELAVLGQSERSLLDRQLRLEGASEAEREYAENLLNRLQGERAHIESLEAASEAAREAQDEIRGFAQNLAASYTSALEDAIIRGNSFNDVLTAMAQDIARLILRIVVLRPLAESLASTFSNLGSGGSGVTGFLGTLLRGLSLFGTGGPAPISTGVSLPTPAPGFSGVFPGLQGGGPANRGRTYIVGERGPELFRPHVSGSIISNADLSRFQGSGGITIQINEQINIESTDGPGVERALARFRPVLESRAEQIARSVTRADLSRPSGLSRR